jgi:hypothetical protein
MTPKQIESLREGLRRNVYMMGDRAHAQETADALLALLRRDWAVRVLDAQGRARSSRAEYPRICVGGGFVIGSLPDLFPTEEASRIAAAQAVYPELSADTRTELGACP